MEHSADTPAVRPADTLSDGYQHGFKPLQSIDVRSAATASQLLEQMSRTAFSGRSLGEAADVLCEMKADTKCFKVGTFSGAMTVAKMSLVLCDMIDEGLLDAVVSTGALMCHGLVEATGLTHFKYEKGWDDKQLFDAGYCRVYDTLELEKNLDDVGSLVHKVLASMEPNEIYHSSKICHLLGKYLAENVGGRGVLISAYKKGIPIFIPAFTDSELGIDMAAFNTNASVKGLPRLRFDPFLDLEHYAGLVVKSERIGIFTVGGGVPRNWAQQIGPYLDFLERRYHLGNSKFARFRYGVRLCPEPAHWGGLSGCTYSEGVSWGKFIPPEEGGRFAEVFADATVVWPILIRAVFERLGVV